MVRKYGCFEETGRSESLKVCGNCRRVRFCLSRENQKLLSRLISWHGAELMCSWLKKGTVMVPGGHRVDLTKTGAVKIILKNPAYCKVAKTKVFYVSRSCFGWTPHAP